MKRYLEALGLYLVADVGKSPVTGRPYLRLLVQDVETEHRDNREPGSVDHGAEIWIEPSVAELTEQEKKLSKYERGRLLRMRVEEPFQIQVGQAGRVGPYLKGPLYRR